MKYSVIDKKGNKVSEFDIQIEVTAKVLPRVPYKDTGEKIIWEGISNEINTEAKILCWSLKDYLEYKAQELVLWKFSPEKAEEARDKIKELLRSLK